MRAASTPNLITTAVIKAVTSATKIRCSKPNLFPFWYLDGARGPTIFFIGSMPSSTIVF